MGAGLLYYSLKLQVLTQVLAAQIDPEIKHSACRKLDPPWPPDFPSGLGLPHFKRVAAVSSCGKDDKLMFALAADAI